MVNILLVNIHSFCNAGDEALTRTAISQLRNDFPDSTITLMMNDSRHYHGNDVVIDSFLHLVKRKTRRRGLHFLKIVLGSLLPVITYRIINTPIYFLTVKETRPIIQAYLKSDIVISNPGGYFHSSGKGLGLLIFIFTMLLAIFVGKPLYLLPQSFGPFIHQRELLLTRYLISRARIVMVREEISASYLSSCGIPENKFIVSPDMAFAFTGDSRTASKKWYQSNSIDLDTRRPLLGVTIMDWGAQSDQYLSQARYEASIAAVIKHFLQKYQGKVIIFSQCWGPEPEEDDRLPGARVVERVKDWSEDIIFNPVPIPPTLLKSLYGELDALIGTRMHSNIFAVSQGVPIIAIGYRHKTLGIAESLGLDQWVVDIDEIDEDGLIKKFDALWINRKEIRAQIMETLPKIVSSANNASSLIASDFRKHSLK